MVEPSKIILLAETTLLEKDDILLLHVEYHIAPKKNDTQMFGYPSSKGPCAVPVIILQILNMSVLLTWQSAPPIQVSYVDL